MISRLLLLFLLSNLASPLFGQQEYNISVDNYNLEDGLSHNQVQWLHKDRRGMLWIGTSNGINRYDGESFKLVVEKNFSDLRRKKEVFEDQEGDLWLYSNELDRKIFFFNTHKEKIKSFEEKFGDQPPFQNADIADAIMLADGTTIIKTRSHELFSFDVNKNLRKIDLGIYDIWDLRSTANSMNIWLQSSAPRDTFTTTYHFFEKQPDGSFEKKAAQIIDRKEILIGITKEETLLLLDEEKGETYTEIDTKGNKTEHYLPYLATTNGIASITYDREEDRFLMVQNGRLKIMFRNDTTDIFKSNSYKNLIIKQTNCTLYKDDILWVGEFHGLTKILLKPSPFKRTAYRDPVFFTRPEFSSVRYIGGYIAAFAHRERIPGSKIEKSFWTRYKDENGRLWTGSHYGVSYLDPGDNFTTKLWSIDDPIRQRTNRVYDFYKDQDGQLWVVTANGLFILDEDKKELTTRYANDEPDHFLPVTEMRHMYQDSDGIYWIGTRKGLLRWDKKNNQHLLYDTKDGLSNNHIMAVYEDDYGFIWMSSDNGIMQFEKKTGKVKIYLPEDGITHREFNRAAHLRDSLGSIYFGSLNGITHFHPKDFVAFNKEESNVPLLLMGCSLFSGKSKKEEDKMASFLEKKKIVMAPGDRYLKLQFALLDYSNPNAIQYVFEIDGETWNAGKENVLNVSGLAYGDHTLIVKGRAGNGLFSKQQISIPIEVLRPVYLQNWFIMLCGIILLFAGYAFQKLRTRALVKRQAELEETVNERTKTIQKQAEELRELDKSKSRFLANISHEFRTPLTLILNTLNEEEIHKITNQNGTKKKLNFSEKEVGIMDRNARRLSQLIEQLLDLSTLEAGKMKLRESVGDFNFYLKELVQSFLPLGEKKNIEINFAADLPNAILNFDRDKIDKIMYNLLSNAIKFTPEKGSINVNLSQAKNNTIIEVRDSGIGVSKEGITRIFDRFYQVNQTEDYTYEGTGLGLALVKELVDVQQGSIQVESEIGQGTYFKIELPLSIATQDSSLDNNNTNTNSQVSSAEEELSDQPILKIGESILPKKEDLPVLLVIEDNEDLRYHHQKTFGNRYQLITTEDGVVGLEKAYEFIPDVIICDVMMPGKNGYEVCEQLKKDERTNHIPIILLTAKVGQEEKIEGLSVGADEYMTKPYDQRELALRISNLLDHANHLRKQLSLQNTINNTFTEKKVTFSPQEAFLLKLSETIEKNLAKRNFGVEELGIAMNLSRSQFSRKLKAITGGTPNQFLRSYRLKRAKEFLVKEEGNATTVSYLTGFSSPNYFFKCFKDEYGMTPGQYMEGVEKGVG